jgi:hypothetical protein
VTTSDVCDTNPAIRSGLDHEQRGGRRPAGQHVPGRARAAFGTDDRQFQLRAERSGQGNGRVYTITYEAKDGSGNVTTSAVTVTVPRSQSSP